MNVETSAPGDEARPTVLVGVDGSEPSTQALILALRLAASREWAVEVVTAWPGADAVPVHEVPGHFSSSRQRAREAQERALTRAADSVAGAPVVRKLVNAHPVAALRDRAARARVVVVGSHGEDRPPGHARRPAVGDSLALLVSCPVVVVQ